MHQKVKAILAVLLVATLLLSACGGGAAPAAEEAAPAEEQAAADTEEAASGDEQAAAGTDGSHEAPMLAEKVAAGELPPLEERIPAEPLIITPYGEIGQYGGTMHRFDTSKDGGHLTMFQYGYSPVHWVQDGLDKRPGLAKGWDFNEEKTEYTLLFREGTRWSDGEPFTTADFMYWWEEMVLNPEHPDVPPDYLISGGELAEITAVDDYTLNIKFAAPAPLLLDRLAMWPNGMLPGSERLFVPRHYLEQFNPNYSDEYDTFEIHDEKMDWRANPEAPVLNPWMPVEYEPGTRMILERNPYYYGVDTAGNQLPYIDTIDVTFIEDWEVGKLRVLAGE
ncbi:MAG: hypothetical protein KDE47_08210, partial [Caldilineaceae bacterium]|nr:hypothetical protein [Caldilineaceae bacterium]